jgi:predicted MFS family arabinose efflux permease
MSESLTPLWRNRDYVLLRGGQFISTLGSGISGIVFPLLILALTNSPAAAGIAAALRALPYVIFSLPVGALIDRWDRKRVMVWCDTGRALTLASVPLAMALGVLTVWQLYIAAFIEGSLYVFFNLAEVAAVPRVVPKVQLPEATAQNQIAYSVADILGPSAGTFAYQTLGQAFPFIFDAMSYAVSVVSLRWMRASFRVEHSETTRHLRAEIIEGLTWLWRQPLILFMALLTGGFHFVFAAERLTVIVLATRLGANETAIGLIFSIAAIGGILGSVVGGWVAKKFSFGQVIIGVVWLTVLLFPLYAIAPNVIVLGIITFLIYVCLPSYDIVQFSYRLALIPDRLQGRVNSAWRLIAFGFDPLGAALGGVLLEWLGPITTIIVFAVWQLGLGLLVAANAHVRNAPRLESVEASS